MSGSVTLQANTALQRFSQELAPSICPNIFKEYPFGFVLDIDPSSGAPRQLLYFSAHHRDVLDTWIWFLLRAICQAAEAVHTLSLDSHPSFDGDDKNISNGTPTTAGRCSGSDSHSQRTSPFAFDMASDSDAESHREDSMCDTGKHTTYCDASVGNDTLHVGIDSAIQTDPCSQKHATYCDASVGIEPLHVCIDSAMQTDSCFDGFVINTRHDEIEDVGSSSNAVIDDASSEQTHIGAACKVDFTSGDPVCLVGLQSEDGSKLNGLRGVLIKFEDSRQRWQVKLRGCRDVKLVRSVNLCRPEIKENIRCPRDSFIAKDDLASFVGDNTCAICFDEFAGSALTITRCGHLFHTRCLTRARTSSCPQCRQSIDDPSAEVVPEADPAPSRELLSALLVLMASSA